MTSILLPCWLLASSPPSDPLLQYLHAEILFSKSKLSLNQINLEIENSVHTPHNITLTFFSFCLPWVITRIKAKKKNPSESLQVPLLAHAFSSAPRHLTLASHSPAFRDFKAQRPQQGTWFSSSLGQAIWVPLAIHTLSKVTEVRLSPLSSEDWTRYAQWVTEIEEMPQLKLKMGCEKRQEWVDPSSWLGRTRKCRAHLYFHSDREQSWYLSALPRATSDEGSPASGFLSAVWRFSLVLPTPGLFPNHLLLKLASVTRLVCLFVSLSFLPFEISLWVS